MKEPCRNCRCSQHFCILECYHDVAFFCCGPDMKAVRIYRIHLACILACCIASCGFVYDYPEDCGDMSLTIVNDWSAAPDANPEGMAYVFFGYCDAHPWRFDFPGTDAGEVMLPEGQYSFASFNDDTYHIRIDGDSYSTLRASTWPASLPEGDGRGEKVVECPDMLWGTSEAAVSTFKEVLTAYQRQITPRYKLRIEEVENLDGVRSVSGALSGMAESYLFSAGRADSGPSTMVFDAGAVGENTIEGEFCTFGLLEKTDVPNILFLFVTLIDGRRFEFHFDVSGQIRKAPDPMSVLIVLRGLTLEKVEPGSHGGFEVEVDGWITEDININD